MSSHLEIKALITCKYNTVRNAQTKKNILHKLTDEHSHTCDSSEVIIRVSKGNTETDTSSQ